MATRTVAVVLTGTVTPYTAAMRAAARTTVTTASSISASMRAASARATASLTSMARTAQLQAARAAASMQMLAARATASMTAMGTRSAAALRAALAPIPSLATRASAAFSRLAARGTAAMTAIRTAATTAGAAVSSRFSVASARASAALTAFGTRASAVWGSVSARAASAASVISARWSAAAAAAGARWPSAAARISAALTAASAASTRAAAITSSRWAAARAALAAGWGTVTASASVAATVVGARWSAASATVSAAMAATRAAAGSAATWVAGRWTAAATVVSSRWAAASATVATAVTAARTTAGNAAAWVATRWAAAGAAMSSAMLSVSAASANAAAAVVTTANTGQKSLKAARTASLGLVAAFGLAAYAAANFDKAMSGVKAVTFASARDLASLRQAAIDAGQATQYSATEAATAEAELAKAGVSVKDILSGGLQGTLALAAAGQLDLADAAVVSAKAMNAFGLSGNQVGHVADVLAAGAGKSATDVHELGMALTQSALLAHQTGLSLEDTAGALSLFAQNGLAGSDAGTSLKTMLMRLTPQSSEAAGMMDKLGFSAYDSSGNFLGLSATAARMQKAFGNLTPEARNAAFGVIFGSDATRAASVIYNAGATGIDKWTKAVNDQGYAAKVAAAQTNNLSGDLERLKGALETALIQSGTAANGVLRGMAQSLTGVVNWYGKLSPEVQKSVTMMTGFVGVTGLIASSLLLVLPRIMTVRRELVALGLTAERTRGMMAGLGRLTLVVGALMAVSYATSKITDAMKATPPSVTKLTNSLVDLAVRGKASGEVAKAFGDDLGGFGDAIKRISDPDGLTKVTDAMGKIPLIGGQANSLTEAKDKVKALDDALTSLVQSGSPDLAAKSFDAMTKAANEQGISTEKLKALFPQYGEALVSLDTQSKTAASGQGQLGDAAATTADELQQTASAAEQLSTALDALNGVNIDAATSQISFRQSLADLTTAVKENGHSLDTATDKGRKVKSAFLDAAKGALSHAEAVAKQKDSVDAGNRVLEQDISALKRTMHQAGFSEEAIKRLTSAYLKIPPKAETKVVAKTGQAIGELDAVQKKVAATKGKSITMKTLSGAAERALKTLGFKVTHMPNGTVRISIPTAGPKASARSIVDYINSQHGTIPVQIYYKAGKVPGAGTVLSPQANGGTVDYYASGGMRERHVAQIAPAGAWRVWGEPETGGEAYIPLAPGKRARSRAIADETVKRLGGKGVAWYANGGISYAPSAAPVLGGAGDAKTRYDNLIAQLKDAWNQYSAVQKELTKVSKGKHTRAQLRAAQKKVADERADVYALDKSLGVSRGAKAPTTFNLKAYQVQLGKSTAATNAWQSNLSKVGTRGGEEVRSILEGMGEDGYALTSALAKASDKQFKDITDKLLKTAGVAKATLADFNKQVNASTKVNSQFSADLQKLAAQGYGDLAQALAAQGDTAAQTLAHQAVGSSKDAASANAAVKANAASLTGDDLTNAITLISTLRGGTNRGYAELIAAGLDTATIKALVPKIAAQIKALPAAYKDTFVKQWVQQGGVAMARGGILNRPTSVLAGEAGIPEAFIPLNSSARSQALLTKSAAAMGYQLVPAGRYASSGGGSAGSTHLDQSRTVILQGAKQNTGEQVADVMRHMVALA